MQMFQVFRFTLYLNKIISSERTELEEKTMRRDFWQNSIWNLHFHTPIPPVNEFNFHSISQNSVSLEKC